ncbi:MAG: YebC/PmpR family DNA-binding transcriptional regulator [Elusimicrobia bacterium]|nr:YebC/PmpR family DNA-binding transcriptional regulator [Elusimicrobiota bacterium]
MGGHSHWAGIKHKKGVTDAKKGKVWTKLVREIAIAARLGGGDVGSNPRLRKAIDDARAANMPSDNVKRAIQRGTGELPGAAYEDLVFEGYGPAGVAIICEATSDNRNRTNCEIKFIFGDHGGNMGVTGCVGWMFKQKGIVRVSKAGGATEDRLMGVCLDLGAEDIDGEGQSFEIVCDPKDFDRVRQGVLDAGIAVESAEIAMVPGTMVPIKDEESAQKVLKLMEALEEHDDIKNVYSNFDIPEAILAKLGA